MTLNERLEFCKAAKAQGERGYDTAIGVYQDAADRIAELEAEVSDLNEEASEYKAAIRYLHEECLNEFIVLSRGQHTDAIERALKDE